MGAKRKLTFIQKYIHSASGSNPQIKVVHQFYNVFIILFRFCLLVVLCVRVLVSKCLCCVHLQTSLVHIFVVGGTFADTIVDAPHRRFAAARPPHADAQLTFASEAATRRTSCSPLAIGNGIADGVLSVAAACSSCFAIAEPLESVDNSCFRDISDDAAEYTGVAGVHRRDQDRRRNTDRFFLGGKSPAKTGGKSPAKTGLREISGEDDTPAAES